MTESFPQKKTALVVLGMHRSGTSAMAGTLSICGAQLPTDPLPANFANPAGYFEPEPVTRFNDELLELLDSGWDDVFSGRPKHYLSNFDRVYQQRASETLDSQYGDGQFIVLKDPRINVLTPFWNRVLVERGYEPLYIIMVRNPLEVARSLGERDGFPLEKGLLLWLENMVSAERDTRAHNRIFVAYEDLLSNWAGVVDRIENASGAPMPRRTPSAANAVGVYLSSRHRHHVATDAAPLERSLTGRRVRDAYALLLAAARSGETEALARLGEIEAALAETREDLGPILADFRTRLRDAEVKAAAQNTATEQTAAAIEVLQRELESAAAQAATLAQALAEAEDARSLAVQLETAAHAERATFNERLEMLEAERDEANRHATAAREEAANALEAAAHARDLSDKERRDVEAELVVANAIRESSLALKRQADGERGKLSAALTQAREAEGRSEDQRRSLEQEVRSAVEKLANAERALSDVTDERDAIIASTSWRLTSLPRRALSRLRISSTRGGT